MGRFLIVKLEPFVGRDVFVSCGTHDGDSTLIEHPIFMIVSAESGEVLDSGYRSFDEGMAAWGTPISDNEPLKTVQET